MVKFIKICFKTILFVLFFFGKSYSDPENFYYYKLNSDDTELIEKIMTEDNNTFDFNDVAKWPTNPQLKVQFYIFSSENVKRPLNLSTFPTNITFDNFFVIDISNAINEWTFATGYDFEDFDVSASAPLESTIWINFYDDFSSSQALVAGMGYIAVKRVNGELMIDYEGDTSLLNTSATSDDNTHVALNNSTDFQNVEINDPIWGINNQGWTMNITASLWEWHLPTVIRHEIGHCLGLNHTRGSEWDGSIMNDNQVGRGVVRNVSDYDKSSLYNLNARYIPPANSGLSNLKAINFGILNNYPNPFNAGTNISYNLPLNMHIEVGIFNALGQRVRTLFKGLKQEGQHHVEWNGKNDYCQNVSSGIYFVSIHSQKYNASKKILLLR
ncbi:T9SS type A sorting domain-containing protein [candidate division KSB1 bacterium]|nr:T9SS type A sorting domain-containing protein [candidate division KSB1 bacterium]